MTDRSAWSVTDDGVKDEIAAMASLADDEIAALVALEAKARDASSAMSDAFYERILGHPHTAEYLSGQDLQQRHAMIADWFVELFAGRYDDDYAARRLAIGATHVRIGLPVRYPLAMLDVVLDHGHRVTAQGDDPALAARAFAKVLAIDVAIFNHAYEHHQLRHLAGLVGGERLARRVLTGET